MKQSVVSVIAVWVFLLLSQPVLADCWRLSNGQIITTNANSTAPVSGAQRVQCNVQQPSQQQTQRQPSQQRTQAQQRTTTIPAQQQPKGDVCAQYYGKGYCTDWITQKMGVHPGGIGPAAWPVTRDPTIIRAGVAVVFGNLAPPFGHVAYVESVSRDQKGLPATLTISEMNYGSPKANVPTECAVSNNFGKVTPRTIRVTDATITGYWSN